jgi:hypothetical protein
MTKLFLRLDRRLKLLERRFLPKSRPLGNYTAGEEDYIRTFIVLSHAEIEAYLENLTESLWESLFEEMSKNSPAKRLLASHIDKLFENTQKTIRDNHGLKAENIKQLLGPFGFGPLEFSSIDPSFLSQLSAFGALRGGVAHRASIQQVGIKKSLDSIRVKKQVQNLSSMLNELDSMVERRIAHGLIV